MKHSICITYLKDIDDCCRHWNYVLKHFPNEEVYIMGAAPWNSRPLEKAKHISSIDELPKNKKVVIMSPQNGKHIKGEISLYEYKHEEDAIYVFGPDIGNLTPEHLGERETTNVYIPCEKSEFYSWVAAAITFHDIGVKEWQQE